MTTYNCASFIKKAITSILNQTYKDFEFLIIDDGSTDNTESIVKSFNDNRINYQRIEPVSYTHLRAHETVLDLVCRLLLEKKKNKNI